MIRLLPARILAAAGLLAGLLVALVIHEDQQRQAGREIRLAMAAVDPRDLLAGHYVALNLTQPLPKGAPCPPGVGGAWPFGKKAPARWIAVTPSPRGEIVTGVAAGRKAALAYGPIVLQGKTECWSAPESGDEDGRVTVKIGVDRFHTDQKQAEAMERALRGRAPPAFAIISIGADGRGRLKGVIVGDKRMDLTWD